MDDRRRGHVHTVALLLLVAIVFGRAAGHEFVNLDDDKFLYANPNLVPPTIEGLLSCWRQPHAHLYVPVTTTAWWLLAQIGSVHDAAGRPTLNPWVFHAASVLVHALNVLLVRRLVRATIRDDLAATVGAAIFAVHPLQAETVAWASEMKDLLAATFSLVALISGLDASTHDGRRWWLLAAASFIAAMLAKPSVVALPIVAMMLLWIVKAPPRQRWGVLLVGVALAVPFALLARHFQQAPDVPATPAWVRPLIAADALSFYVAKLLLPMRLAVDYGRTPSAAIASGAIYWTWIIPVAITALLAIMRRPVPLVAWLIFICAAATNLGLIPFDFQIVSTVADHYLYPSFLGVALLIAWIVASWPRVRWFLVAATLVLASLAFVQVGYWRDSDVLWQHTLSVNDRSGLANVNLGVSLLNQGNVPEATRLFRKAAEVDRNDPFAHMNLTRALLMSGDTAGAARSASDMATAYARRRDFDPALTAAVLDRFADAIEQRGDHASAAELRDQASRLRSR